jgi:hypothetical protein
VSVALMGAVRNFLLAAAAVSSFAAVAVGCGSTEFFYEGQGQLPDRATGTVPPGEIGVCKRPNTHRPLIVGQKLWDDAKLCTAKTPTTFIQLGFGTGEGNDVDPDGQQQRLLTVLHEGENENTGNTHLVTFLRALHEYALKDPRLKEKVSRDTARDAVCDYTYLLNTMSKQRAKLETSKCTAMVYDQTSRSDACLFDDAREESLWLTSSWSCIAHTGAIGEEMSCHRLCAYDDFCAKQVTCTAPDVDLMLCAMGVCLPSARTYVW